RSEFCTYVDRKCSLPHYASSIEMKHFFHAGPPFAGGAGLKRTLHRSHYLPPLLCLGISRHLRHVRLKICTMVFPITEQQIIFEEDGIIANIAISDHVQNLGRSEEHTSELQSRGHLVCRLLLEKKN